MFNLPPPRHISTLPESCRAVGQSRRQRRAISDYMHGSKTALYSITSSARSRIDCGTVRPSVLAVLRFKIISYLTGN